MSKGYLCLDPSTNKVYTPCYALFNENLFHIATNPNLTHAYLSFSVDVTYAHSFASNVLATSTDPCPNSSHSTSTVTPFPFELFQSSSSISYVPNPLISSLSSFSNEYVPSIIPSTSSSDPSLPIPVNHHPMLTRSKLGIHKPKVFKVVTSYTY